MEELLPLVLQLTNPDQVSEIPAYSGCLFSEYNNFSRNAPNSKASVFHGPMQLASI